MKRGDLARPWPDYRHTHRISEDELTRIAEEAGNIEEAKGIWEDEDWWNDREHEAMKSWPGGYSRYARGEITWDEYRRIIDSAQAINRIYPRSDGGHYFGRGKLVA